MKLRLRSSFNNSVQASVALTVLLGTVVGCGDDDSTPPPFEIDGGVSSSSSATSEPTAVTPTSGDEPSETTGPHSTTNPTTTTSEDPTGEPTGPVDTSETPVETTSEIGSSTDLSTDGPTTGPVTSDLPTTGPVDTSGPGTEDTGGPVTPIGVGASDPPGDVVLVSNFEDGDNLGYRDYSGLNPTITYENSVANLVIPFTAGNQNGGLDFNISGNHCGQELVARMKLVSGFDGDGHVQLRAWSSDWGAFVGSWTAISASSQTGQWIEYSFDLDNAVNDNANFDVTAINHIGIAFITDGGENTPHSTATVEVDWIGFREKDGGCPGDTSGDTGSTNGGTDTGAVSDPDAGVVDTGETMVPGDGGVIDTVTPSEGDASVDEPTMDYGDASVSEPPATSSPETSAPATSGEVSSSGPSYGPNLFSNYDFEAGQTWWWYAPGAPGQTIAVNALAHSGSYSLLAQNRTMNWHGLGINLLSAAVTDPLVQGTTYHAVAYVRTGVASASVALALTQTCDSATTYPTIVSATATNTGWTLLEGDFTVPTCTSLSAYAFSVQSSDVTTDLYGDDFELREVQ